MRTPEGVPTGNGKFIALAVLLLGAIGAVIAWKTCQKPVEPPPLVVVDAGPPPRPSKNIDDDIPPPPVVEDAGTDAGKKVTTAVFTGNQCDVKKCTGSAGSDVEAALSFRAKQSHRCYDNALAQDPTLARQGLDRRAHRLERSGLLRGRCEQRALLGALGRDLCGRLLPRSGVSRSQGRLRRRQHPDQLRSEAVAMRWQRGARAWVVVSGALAVLGGTILMGCTDGVTPDCSDAATQCGPNVDGSADSNEAALFPETSQPDGASDAQSDADADLDAGDEN